jgi:hypothetical protein
MYFTGRWVNPKLENMEPRPDADGEFDQDIDVLDSRAGAESTLRLEG